MVCLYCGGKTQVVNSRQQRRNNTTWRRRECLQCAGIYTTQEVIKLESALLVASQTGLQPFSRDRLWLSLRNALGHRQQPTDDATSLTETVISKLLPKVDQARLTRQQIITVSTEVLKHFDTAAASHYQAYHPSKG